MIKVLYIITKSDIGGAQKYIADLAENLDKKQFQAKIIYGSKDLKWLSNQIWLWALFLNDWLAIWELIKIYKKEQPGIIHLNSSKAGILGSIAALFYKTLYLKTSAQSPKIVFTAHGWVFNPTNAISWPIRWLYILLHKFTALFQDKIICVSEYDYKLALQYKIALLKKLTVIHNGIDPNINFIDKETAKKEIFKKLLANKPWIGSVGRLVKEKNYETFIQAAALIPNAYFFIIGEGPEREALNKQLTANNLEQRFFIIDPTGTDAKYLKAFDIFVMSSIKEGLPYILLEAMAAGVPIVATKAGGIPEMIKNCENGLLISQKNPRMLAEAIQSLINKPGAANELKESAKKTLMANFNIKNMVLATENIYKNLLLKRSAQ